MIFRSRIYYNIDKIAFCHEDLNQIKKKTDEDKELLRLVEKKNKDNSFNQGFIILYFLESISKL